ncbi:MAG: hypothetical protein ACE5G7_03590 [Candidatus Hydrothermarchaeaceae archaeon]
MSSEVQSPMQGDQRKVQELINEYAQKFGALLDEKGLSRHPFSLFKPHNMFYGLDQNGIHVILSFNNAIPSAMLESSGWDFRGNVVQEAVEVRHQDPGFEEHAEFSLPASLLTMSDSEREQAMEQIARERLEQEWQAILGQKQPLYITEDRLRGFLANASRGEFVQAILVPLLRQMGFERVRQGRGEGCALEFGRDIERVKFRLPTGQYLYFAVQVEAGEVDPSAYNSLQIEVILNQMRAAFERPIFDYDLYTNVYVDQAMLVASGGITKLARVYLQGSLQREKGRNVAFMDQDDLVELCKQNGLPGEIQRLVENYG